MSAYASEATVYRYALPRGSLGNPGRIVASALAATSQVELAEHGFENGQAVSFRVTQGGALSAPLVAGTTYYVLYLSDSFFQVSATPLGSPITLTTDAEQMIVTADLPWDDVCERYSRFADAFLPAEAVPLATPYPVTIVAIVSELVAKRMQILSGTTSDSMRETELSAKAQLERYAAGLPVRDVAPTQLQTNLAIHNARPDRLIGRPFFGGTSTPSDNGGFDPFNPE